MSSHHIVREKQEPALLVLGLDNFPFEVLGQLLEWSPTVIATEQSARALISNGIKVDWIITNNLNEYPQSDIKQIPSGSEKPVEAALKYLVTHSYPAVNIITNDFQLKDYLFFADKINLVIFHGEQRIYAVNSGFSKWKPAGEKIELLSQPHNLQYSGLEPLGRQSFKTMHDGFFTLRFDQSLIFVSESV
jgi:thiamine pyrophosphokinase